MTKRLITTSLAAAGAILVLTVAAGVASASPAAAKPKVVPIVMGDPGCHWFRVSGKNKLRLAVSGKTAFRNLDEAALIFKGAHFYRKLAVGKTLAVTKPGKYQITMVGQHPDDNTLILVVKSA